MGSWTVPASLLLVAAVSPFERPLPGSLLGFTFTTLELSIAAALVAAGLAAMREPSAWQWRTPITIPVVALLACALVSSCRRSGISRQRAPLRRPVRCRDPAVHGRCECGGFTTIGAAAGGGTAWRRGGCWRDRGARARAGTVRARRAEVVSPGLPCGWRPAARDVDALLSHHHLDVSRSGVRTRFDWIASSRLAFAALVLAGAGIIATFTRAGLITMTISLLTYGGIAYFKRRQWGHEHTKLAALAAVLIALVMLSRSPQMLVSRMSNELSQDWYGATYDVPGTVTLRPDSFNDIPVTLSNRGWLTWQSDRGAVVRVVVSLAVDRHRRSIDLRRSADAVSTAGGSRRRDPGGGARARTRIPGHVPAGMGRGAGTSHLAQPRGRVPGPHHREGGRRRVSAPLPTRGRMPAGNMRMPRAVLWSTAIDIARDHPVLGIGPDNFRLLYGSRLGLAAWDTRVHTNNTYLEVLVGLGVVGLVPLLWLLFAGVRSTLASFRAALVNGAADWRDHCGVSRDRRTWRRGFVPDLYLNLRGVRHCGGPALPACASHLTARR